MVGCILLIQVIIYHNTIIVYADQSQKDMNQITTESYHNLIRIFSFLMFQQTTKKKLQKIKTTVIKNQWL